MSSSPNIFQAFYDEQARKESELRDLRVLCRELIRRAGGEVTFKRSDLMNQTVAEGRAMLWYEVDEIHDSITIRLDEEFTVRE